MLNKIIIGFWVMVLSFGLSGQDLDFRYSFDGCDAATSDAFYNGIIIGDTPCVCGLNGDALHFAGDGEELEFPRLYRTFFLGNFTIDFYFSLGQGITETTDILSYRKGCELDSLIAVKYFPQRDELLFEIAKNINTYQSLRIPIDDRCWHRFTLVRNALNYIVYLNNVRVGTIIAEEEVPMSPDAALSINGDPCDNTQVVPFLGRVDEFRILNRPMSEAEIIATYLFPEEISNRDTTIFRGESVDIRFGPGCQSLDSWTPTTGLDDPTVLEPTASPDRTTTYRAITSDNFCTSVNELTIYVIDPDSFDCAELLLPTAFTPNGDGLNDRFGISNQFIVQEMSTFYIMDEWGNRVFESTDKSAQWDGTYNDKKLNPGVFTYVIDYVCRGIKQSKVGTVVLLI